MLARPAQISFIGDSHVLIYDDLLFADKAFGGHVVTRAAFLPGFMALGFADPTTGMPTKAVLESLRFLLLIGGDGDAFEALSKIEDGFWMNVHKARARSIMETPVVFSCGELDGRALLRELGTEARFELPFEPSEPLEPIEESNIIPYSLVESRALDFLKPFFGGRWRL